MKNLLQFIIILILLPTISGRAATFDQNSAILTNPHMPWNMGAQFTLVGTGDATGISLRYNCVSIENIQNISCLKIELTDIGRANLETHWWLAQDTDGNIWQLQQSDEQFDGSFETETGEWLYVPASFNLSESREMYGIYPDVHTVVSLDGNATTPFGTYSSCIVTEAMDFGTTSQSYIAPGFGPVKHTFSGSENGTFELQSVSGFNPPTIPQSNSIDLQLALIYVEEDDGGFAYSGTPVGTKFILHINLETGASTISKESTVTQFNADFEDGSYLYYGNDDLLDEDNAAVVNSLAGTNFKAGDLIDALYLDGGIETPGGEVEVLIDYILNPSTFDTEGPTNLSNPPNPNDILAVIVSFTEFSNGGKVYSAVLGEVGGGIANPMPSELVNISTRGKVGTLNSIMIGGFVIEGNDNMTVLIQGVGQELIDGETLTAGNILANPSILLLDSDNNTVASNDNWESEDAAIKAQAMTDAGSFQLPTTSQSSAILRDLPPGLYTVFLFGVGETEGISLIEVYQVPTDNETDSSLINISTRGDVKLENEVMIGGFVIAGTENKTVLIQGVGPELVDGETLTVENTLADPYIILVDSGNNTVATNDNWENEDATAKTQAMIDAGSFTLVPGSQSAAILTHQFHKNVSIP